MKNTDLIRTTLCILICLSFICEISASEKDSITGKASHLIGFDFRPAYVFPTHDFFKGENNAQKSINTTLSGNLKYGFQFSPDSKFGKLYPYAIQGVGLAPNIACVNVHPSLLPKYRGANPYFYAIKNGEKTSGITFHMMNEKIDRGDILMQRIIPISDVDTGETLRIKTSHQASTMVIDLLNNFNEHLSIPMPQNEAVASYCPKIFYEDLLIDWTKPAKVIYDLIRASHPWCCCYTRYKNNIIEIRSAGIVSYDGIIENAGTIINNDKRGIVVSTGDKNKAILLTDTKFHGSFYNLFNKTLLKKIKKNDKFE